MDTNRRFDQFPGYMFGKSKMIRNKNWELLEIQVLKKMIDNHYELLNSRHTNAMINARKNLVWKRIADSINALGLHRRTVRELKIKWSNMRLTEKRKSSGSQHTTGSQDYDSERTDDVVDISQSSYESESQLNSPVEQGITQNQVDAIVSNDVTSDKSTVQPQQLSLCDSNIIQNHHLGNANESNRLLYTGRLNTVEPSLPVQKQHSVNIENEMSTSQIASWPLAEYSSDQVRQNTGESNILNSSKDHVLDFSQDRIYLPGVVIKPEPNNFQQMANVKDTVSSVRRIPEFQSTAIQTDWKLSGVGDYVCPSLSVSERDISAIKFEILNLEKANLLLKNENMELQNAKLRLEISRHQSDV
ncbi:uncharacterized protein LOC127734245 [Mytilus californianus]|uniref:uncharacterized protein LOC127734245 n=1 Tax=Mytilus californianus TaxID=6549 RepID=UPI0022455335|nr:uncharacterized protein LOC127734245 [Mytilus californianus]